MSWCPRRSLVALASALAVSGAAAAPLAAAPLLINNGSAPPNPENVIDGPLGPFPGMNSSELLVVVRNQDCSDLSGPCPVPGAPTEVEITSNAIISGQIDVLDSSRLTATGGYQCGTVTLRDAAVLSASAGLGSCFSVAAYGNSAVSMSIPTGQAYMSALRLYDSTEAVISGAYFGMSGAFTSGSSRLVMAGGGEVTAATDTSSILLTGGSSNWLKVDGFASILATGHYRVGDEVQASGQGRIQFDGGLVSHRMRARDSSAVTILGHDFSVCELLDYTGDSCTPVGPGLLAAQQGQLRGTALSGEEIRINDFSHTGQIWLVPEPGTALLLALGLASLAARRRRARFA